MATSTIGEFRKTYSALEAELKRKEALVYFSNPYLFDSKFAKTLNTLYEDYSIRSTLVLGNCLPPPSLRHTLELLSSSGALKRVLIVPDHLNKQFFPQGFVPTVIRETIFVLRSMRGLQPEDFDLAIFHTTNTITAQLLDKCLVRPSTPRVIVAPSYLPDSEFILNKGATVGFLERVRKKVRQLPAHRILGEALRRANMVIVWKFIELYLRSNTGRRFKRPKGYFEGVSADHYFVDSPVSAQNLASSGVASEQISVVRFEGFSSPSSSAEPDQILVLLNSDPEPNSHPEYVEELVVLGKNIAMAAPGHSLVIRAHPMSRLGLVTEIVERLTTIGITALVDHHEENLQSQIENSKLVFGLPSTSLVQASQSSFPTLVAGFANLSEKLALTPFYDSGVVWLEEDTFPWSAGSIADISEQYRTGRKPWESVPSCGEAISRCYFMN